MQQEFWEWLKLFDSWLQGFAGEVKQIRPLEIFERRLGDGRLESRLVRLPDNDSRFGIRPGGLTTWKLVHYSAPRAALLITLDNLYRLSLELPKVKQSEIIKRGLERSQGLTHRFQVTWYFRSQSGKLRFIIIDSFDVDLSSRLADGPAVDIIGLIAADAFTMRHVPSIPWRERIQHFPWYESIKELSPKKGCPQNPRWRQLATRMQKVTIS